MPEFFKQEIHPVDQKILSWRWIGERRLRKVHGEGGSDQRGKVCNEHDKNEKSLKAHGK